MSLSIQTLNLGDVDIDYSFLVWGTNQGKTVRVPTNCYLVLGADKPILIDSSFRDTAEVLASSGLVCYREPEHSLETNLAKFGLKPADIGYIIHTHLHVDHTGLDDQMPNAKILVQRKELQYGAAPLFPVPFYDRVDLSKLVGPLWNRLELLDGDCEIVSGVNVVVTGGHSFAHQVVYIDVPSGTAIACGDNAYITEMNIGMQLPSGYYLNLFEVMAGLARIKRDGKHILPVHDEQVIKLYPDGIK